MYKTARIITENGLVGILDMPAAQSCPAVLMLHGFASHKDEVGDIFKRTAACLALKGVGSLRFDFSGWGESAGRMEDTTLQSLLGDAHQMLNILMTQKGVEIDRLGVLGFSLGSGVAMLLAGENPQVFTSMVLLSPVARLKQDFLQSLGADAFQRAANGLTVDIDLGWRQMRLSPTFFKGLDDNMVLGAAQAFRGRVMMVAGRDDRSVENTIILKEEAGLDHMKTVLLDGADHNFNVLGDKDASGEVIRQVTDWFSQTL
jgi:uncharacterized protein